jgi:hypothetical protein
MYNPLTNGGDCAKQGSVNILVNLTLCAEDEEIQRVGGVPTE